MQEVDNIFKEYFKLGVIEKVEQNDGEPTAHHYLPHRPVLRPDKSTTKIREVFDASSKQNGFASLNLYTGPSLTPSLFGVLLRFRCHNVAFTRDIEKAFLQIKIDPTDREMLRFLWFSDVNNFNADKFELNELSEFRLCRVLFGATCSPFLLTGTQPRSQRLLPFRFA